MIQVWIKNGSTKEASQLQENIATRLSWKQARRLLDLYRSSKQPDDMPVRELVDLYVI